MNHLAALAVVGGIGADVAALRLLLPAMKGYVGELQVKTAVSGLCAASVHDVLVQDERGLTQIDHILLTSRGIVAIETKNYAGTLYDNGRGRPWVQRIGRRSNKLHNPLDQNYRHRKALESILPGIPVMDLVVLAGPARFGNGRPERVLTLRELKKTLRTMRDDPEPAAALSAAWNRLLSVIQTDKATRRKHLQSVPGGTVGAFRVTLGKALLFFGTAFLLAGYLS
ncbi:MAG: NERD domain-containing protein [Acidithiobacillus sp.]|nr:NERD domain-containing protein [Acidithiobacillus sp.]